MVKFIHTSDWQVGMKGGGLGDAGALVGKMRIETIGRILEIAGEEGAAFVVASGDLFEDNKVGQSLVDEVARILRAFKRIEVHAIPGNHDLPGPGSVWNRSALRGVGNLHVHTEPGPVGLVGGEVTLHPFPVHTRYAGRDPLESLEDLSGRPGIHIGIAHGHLTTVTFGSHENIHLPIHPEHVDRSGLDYLALGHWHGTHTVKTRDGFERIAYSGTHEQTAYGEKDAGNVLVVEIAGKGAPPVVRRVRSGALTWASEELAFSGDANLDRLRRLFDGQTVNFLRLELSGELPDSLFEEYRDLLDRAEDRFKDLRVRKDSLRWLRDEEAGPVPIGEPGLEEVRKRLLGYLSGRTEEETAVAREAQVLFRRYVKEAGL